MSIDKHARRQPSRPALIEAETGEAMTFAELNDASIKAADLLRARLSPGDRVAILLDNGASYFVSCWACRRSGLRFVGWHPRVCVGVERRFRRGKRRRLVDKRHLLRKHACCNP